MKRGTENFGFPTAAYENLPALPDDLYRRFFAVLFAGRFAARRCRHAKLGEAETLVKPNFSTNQITNDWQPPRSGDAVFNNQPPPKKSNTGLTVALTILATLLIIGGATAGLLIYRNSKKTEIAQNTNVNAKPTNSATPTSANVNQKSNTNTNANAAANANANAAPTASPSARPTLNPKQSDAIKSDLKDVIENWKGASESLDLDAHLANYADTVDYYKAGKVPLSKVRADKEKAYSMYNNITVNIDNVKITPDDAGEKATAVFDKEWDFESDERSNSGKVQQQLTFSKIGGEWRITGEKDVKVYYVNKEHGE